MRIVFIGTGEIGVPSLRALLRAAEHQLVGAVTQPDKPVGREQRLTAQRREKVVTVKWDDIADGVWTIATEAREKGNAGSLQLPAEALAIINSQPRMAQNPHVFAASRGGGGVNGFPRAKATFDAACGVTGWVLHDLRRTARSLMSRAGVSSEHAERVLGHVIGGVEGIYDRHQYDHEKADVLAKLAALINTIINPPADNVRQLRRRAVKS